MVLELVAARLIARHLGSSLYTWTAVIGVVLAGLSLGYTCGGQIADRFHAKKALAVLFAVSSLTCALTIVLNNLVGQLIWLWELTWPARVFAHVFLVFMIPSTLLGAISPVVAKMALDLGLPTGRTVGSIYTWGAIGSIAGVFAAGFWLIPAIGTAMIVWLIGGVLLLMAILYGTRIWLFCTFALIFVLAMVMAVGPMRWCLTAGAALGLREAYDPTIIYRAETPYCYVRVKQISKEPDKREFIQDKLTHSRIVMGDITDLQYSYTEIYAAITHGLSLGKDKLSIMLIGGGGYVYPRYVEKMWPDSLIEVVEIDPGVTEAAMQAFGLKRDTTIKTLNMDARNYVDQLLQHQHQTGKKRLYDFIYGDASNDYSAPYQLLTKEFNDKISQILADDGAYMLTTIDIYEQAEYLGTVINTLRQTFPHVEVITEARMPDWARNTFVVVAAKRQLDIKQLISKYPKELQLQCLNPAGMDYLREKSRGMVLTDDYAPVENLLAPVVRQSAKGYLAHKYMKDAQRLAALGRLKESVASYKKAVEIKPQLTIDAFSQIGRWALQHGDYPIAVEVFKKTIEHNEKAKAARNLANIHFELGIALENLQREKEAKDHFQKAAQGFQTETRQRPKSALSYSNLAAALVKIDDPDAAAKAFQRAIELDPDDPTNYVALATVLESQRQYDEGIALLLKAINDTRSKGRQDDLDQLRAYLEVLEFKKWKLTKEQKQ